MAIYIVKVGLQASKARLVTVKSLFIAPTVFTVVSVHTLLTRVDINYVNIGIWGIFIFIGIKAGQRLVGQLDIKIDKKHSLIQLPGTWSTLVIMLVIFFTKFSFGYELTVDPKLAEHIEFEISMLVISAFCTGLLIGRLVGYLYCLKNGEDIALLPEIKS